MSPDRSLLESALRYAAKGKPVFPLRAKGKSPLTASGLKEATTDTIIIRRWWSQWPDANIGLLTGELSEVFVLDVDGELGEKSLQSHEAVNGKLPPTIEVTTGKGRHLYFRWPEHGSIRNSAGKIGAGLDIRGNGGYVVAPPSVHETGQAYRFSDGNAGMLASAPIWLLDLLQDREGQTPPPNKVNTSWESLLKEVKEGQRNDALARITGALLCSDLHPYIAVELCLAWNEARCNPSLPKEEVLRTINSIAKRELTKRKKTNE